MLGGSDLQTQQGARPAGSNTETRGVGQTAPTRRDYRTLLASCPQPRPPSSWGKELSLASISGGGAPLDHVVGGRLPGLRALGRDQAPGMTIPGGAHVRGWRFEKWRRVAVQSPGLSTPKDVEGRGGGID